MSFLDPTEMGQAANKKNVKRLKTILKLMNVANRISDSEIHEVVEQFKVYTDDIVIPRSAEFIGF
jgi:hypothetical protein